MLKSLSVQNYALISSLEIDFQEGLSAITGETGAGKSILMGALGLVLGARADTTALKNKTGKCIVEAGFMVDGLGLEVFFEKQDLDYDPKTLIRRELLPNGKSRAFVNDTPVTLPVLKSLGNMLVSIHAQHHNLILREENFPLEVLDAFLGLDSMKNKYLQEFNHYKEIKTSIKIIQEELKAAQKEQDYLEFQYRQLADAKLIAGEEDALAEEQEILNHAEEIRLALSSVTESFSEDERNVLQLIKKSIQELSSVSEYFPELDEPGDRLNSVFIELKDLSNELEQMQERVASDPERLSILNERIDLLFTLQRKHQVNSSAGLIEIQKNISSSLEAITTSDIELVKLTNALEKIVVSLENLSGSLRDKRLKGLSDLSNAVVANLMDVGMPHAQFEIQHTPLEDFGEYGKDRFSFLFSANKNHPVELVQKVASGGEISRLMLTIKSLVSESLDVPTLIFDEIDAGVSGEIADKMGKMLKRIAKMRQVINVTHLPQVAGRSDYHYQVFKNEDADTTHTGIRLLDTDSRILEMAKMLSGEQLTKEALGNARALLHKS